MRLKISQKIKLDPAVLLETLSKTAEVAYQHANVDYQAALRDFCLATLGDILYDVLRKSAINKIIQKEISLYCVYSAMGRHIPSIERVSTIVSTISSGIQVKI